MFWQQVPLVGMFVAAPQVQGVSTLAGLLLVMGPLQTGSVA